MNDIEDTIIDPEQSQVTGFEKVNEKDKPLLNIEKETKKQNKGGAE